MKTVFCFGAAALSKPYTDALCSIDEQNLRVLVLGNAHTIQAALNNLSHGLTTVISGHTNLGGWDYQPTPDPIADAAAHADFGLCLLDNRNPSNLGGHWHQDYLALYSCLAAGKPVKVIRLHDGKSFYLRNIEDLPKLRADAPYPGNPIAKSISTLYTPKQAVMIKAMCHDLDIPLTQAMADFFHLDNLELEIITRHAVSALIDHLKPQYKA